MKRNRFKCRHSTWERKDEEGEEEKRERERKEVREMKVMWKERESMNVHVQ